LRFLYESPAQRVCFGTGKASELLRREVAGLGERVMLVAAEAEAAMAQTVVDALPVVGVFRDVAMHVPLDVAERAREMAQRHSADVIVSIGGGSTTGTAKAVALTSGTPVVCVPTTYAGSEATSVWGITENARKRTGVDPRVLPRSIIYDAELSRTLPVAFSIASGLNALAHCVDSMWAPRANLINRAFALAGVRALRRGLPQITSDPQAIDGREQMLLASYLAATAFASAGSGLHHKLCHVLGGSCDLPHAETHAVVLPYVLAFNGGSGGQAMRELAAAFEAETADAGLDGLRAQVGAPSRLSDYGLRADQVTPTAREVVAAVPQGNPRPVSASDVEAIIEAARVGADPQIVARKEVTHG
jgi:maleylacetate reductase